MTYSSLKKTLAVLALSTFALLSCDKEKNPGDDQNVIAPDGTVDMGLLLTREDGSQYRLFWAECNLGASLPEEIGDFYAWGEVYSDKPSFDMDSYKWCNGTKRVKTGNNSYVIYLLLTRYCPKEMTEHWGGNGDPDGKTEFSDYGYADDAARANLGGKWRTPTEYEWLTLRRNAITMYVTYKGVSCMKITSKITGNSIYLPATGVRKDTFHENKRDWCYMSSTVTADYPTTAQTMIKNHGGTLTDGIGRNSRWIGMNVRPVWEEPVP